MTTVPNPSSSTSGNGESFHSGEPDFDSDEGIDLREVFSRLRRGVTQILGFAVLGIAIAAVIHFTASPFTSIGTSMRVSFAFEGYGKGENPDHSKFEPDDIRAPDIILAALKRQGLETAEEIQAKVRDSITIEGLIPANVTKERDRLRAAGQVMATYLPDEYLVTLTLPRKFPLSNRQREQLLIAIINSYQEKFQRTYAEIPTAFGNAFDVLQKADFYEYGLILDTELQNIKAYLSQQINEATTFRSPTTNLTFNDLITQTELFSQIQLSETLGLIRENGLSRNRQLALIKINYYLRTLGDREAKAIEEEKVVDSLLTSSQGRSQNYVLGIKSQAVQDRPETPILDQGLIDSLVANDSANFLVHKALEAGLKVKGIQAEEAQMVERRKDMEAFLNRNPNEQVEVVAQVQRSLVALEASYLELISNIRKTQADFSRQHFADAIRISTQPVTDSFFKPLIVASAIGGLIGLALGIGLSLLGIYIGTGKL